MIIKLFSTESPSFRGFGRAPRGTAVPLSSGKRQGSGAHSQRPSGLWVLSPGRKYHAVGFYAPYSRNGYWSHALFFCVGHLRAGAAKGGGAPKRACGRSLRGGTFGPPKSTQKPARGAAISAQEPLARLASKQRCGASMPRHPEPDAATLDCSLTEHCPVTGRGAKRGGLISLPPWGKVARRSRDGRGVFMRGFFGRAASE